MKAPRITTTLIALAMLLPVTQCAIPRTQIIVWVWSDLGATGAMGLTKLYVRIVSSRGIELDRTFTVGSDDGAGHVTRVPGVVAVAYPVDNNAASEIVVDVMPRYATATGDMDLLLHPSHHVVSFRPGHTDLLPVYLLASCRSSTCNAPDSTCTLAGCVSAHDALSDYRGTFPVPADGSVDGSTGFCDGGLTNCSGACVDLNSSADHCGTCAMRCGMQMSCTAGRCVCVPDAGSACGSACFNLRTDNSNCGACGNVCPTFSGCVDAACLCEAPYMLCGNVCVDLSTSVDNCGACGHRCNAMGSTCSGGVCHCGSTVCTSGQFCCGVTTCC